MTEKQKPNISKRVGDKKGKATTVGRRKTIGKNLGFAAAEAYKLLRTNLMFSMADESECKVIGLTSAIPGEGKSTTSANLAYTLAQSGKKTLLLEADMRLPVQAGTFQLEESPGLSHVLTGMATLNEAVRQQTPLRTMCILPAGEIPPNPSELLSSKAMGSVVETLSKSFDYILIDLPPINAVSDGLAVAKLLTGMIMVVRQDYCDQHSLAEAMRRLELLEVKMLGFVMTGAHTAQKRYKKYGPNGKYSHTGGYYSYGYYRKPKGNSEAGSEKG